MIGRQGGVKSWRTTLPATAKAATSKLMKEKQKAQRPRERFFAAEAAPCWPAEAPKAFFGDAIRCWIESASRTRPPRGATTLSSGARGLSCCLALAACMTRKHDEDDHIKTVEVRGD